MSIISDLADRLKTTSRATVARTDRTARNQLVEAARLAQVRVAIRRDGDSLVAEVLSPEEGEVQRVRGVVFRACNQLKVGLDTLTGGTIETTELEDDIADLRDIISELETYARELEPTT